jgi:hypothetical protein
MAAAVAFALSVVIVSLELSAPLADSLVDSQAMLPLWRTAPPSVTIRTDAGLVTGETVRVSGRSAVTRSSCEEASK